MRGGARLAALGLVLAAAALASWQLPLLKAFVAAIIGGFGSIAGALLGGYLLGALEIGIVAFLPGGLSPYRDAIVFALLIAFLLLRPNGLLRATREIKL